MPIHLRVEDKEIFLVDESTMPDGNGVIGEIAVRSRYMSPGYWSKSDQGNAKNFVEDANTSRTFLTGDFGKMGSDGMLVYVGRKDNQVNIRGFRVDLTEIEANIRNLGVCQDVAVLAQQLGEEESRLVAYVVLTQDLMQSDHDLRSKLFKHFTKLHDTGRVYLPGKPPQDCQRKSRPHRSSVEKSRSRSGKCQSHCTTRVKWSKSLRNCGKNCWA